MLANLNSNNQEIKRELYVAMTRAKHRLDIHYNGNYFSQITSTNLTYKKDAIQYPVPEQISIMMSFADVNLSYFGCVQHRINSLRSGSSLSLTEDGLADADGNLVLKFSRAFSEKLKGLKANYLFGKGQVSFIVYWKGQAASDKEIKIILPELILNKTTL